MARLYADENFPQPAVERLRELGHDVLTVQDAGKAQQKLPDEAVLADASGDGRAVVFDGYMPCADTSLSWLRQYQSKRAEAGELLVPIYDWFTKGFDTTEFLEARELVDALV